MPGPHDKIIAEAEGVAAFLEKRRATFEGR